MYFKEELVCLLPQKAIRFPDRAVKTNRIYFIFKALGQR